MRSNFAPSLLARDGGGGHLTLAISILSLSDSGKAATACLNSLLLSLRLKSLIEDFHVAVEKLRVNYNWQQPCLLQVRIVRLKCWILWLVDASVVSACDCLLLDMLIISLLYKGQIQIVLSAFLKRVTMLKAVFFLLQLAFFALLYLLPLKVVWFQSCC